MAVFEGLFLQRLEAWLRARNPTAVTAFLLALTVLIGLAHIATKADAFTALYLLPIVLAGWFVGRVAGVATAAVASGTALLTDGHPLLRLSNAYVELVIFVVIVALVARLQRLLEHEHERSRVDPLTGVRSRLGFFEDARRELIRANRTGRPVAVAYFDIDNFKQVNDALGHDAGDALLRLTGRLMRQELRAIDVVGRLGGDELVVLLPEISQDDAAKAISRVRACLTQAARLHHFEVGFSVGLLHLQTPTLTLEQAIAEADRRMYAEKHDVPAQPRRAVAATHPRKMEALSPPA